MQYIRFAYFHCSLPLGTPRIFAPEIPLGALRPRVRTFSRSCETKEAIYALNIDFKRIPGHRAVAKAHEIRRERAALLLMEKIVKGSCRERDGKLAGRRMWERFRDYRVSRTLDGPTGAARRGGLRALALA